MRSSALVAGLQRHVGNPIVAAILRSPVHGLLSRSVMLLTLRGRRTGAWHTVPVGYVAQERALDVLVANRQVKAWWRNLEGGAPVELVLRGRTMRATAQALTFEREPRAFTLALRNYVARNPHGARLVGIRDVEDVAGLRSVAGTVAMVKVHPLEPASGSERMRTWSSRQDG
ncbi:MAG TPA: nitroreductase/quinone reductase family protein [Candidatus Dormibacteraeota bacterium]